MNARWFDPEKITTLWVSLLIFTLLSRVGVGSKHRYKAVHKR
jgi:hypothetical protein